MIYVTKDEHGREVGDGYVEFKDGSGIQTGKDAKISGIWLFSVPEGGVLVITAQVKYIRKEEPETRSSTDGLSV